MAYVKSLKSQQWLLPPSIEELIPEDHICFLVERVVESMDYSSFDDKYSGAGAPAYHPQIIIKLLIMAMLDGVRSSRKIDRLAKENVVYMYLAEKLKPDFRTISDFRKNNQEIIKEVFKHTVILAKEFGCVAMQHLAIDGSKIKASASNKNAVSKNELAILEEFVKNELKEGLDADEVEDKLFGSKRGSDQLNINKRKLRSMVKDYVKRIKEDPKSTEKIKRNIDKAKQELESKKLNKVSITDPGARYMKHMKGGIMLSYNPQVTVDSKCGIIVANEGDNKGDEKQLENQVLQAEETLGDLEDAKLLADNGYFEGKNLRFLLDKNIDAYIPDQNAAMRIKGKKVEVGRFDKENFKYDPEKDVFICPENKELVFCHEDIRWGKKCRDYRGTECKTCPCYKECTTSKDSRRVKSYPYEIERQEMVKKMKTAEAKKTYEMRKMIVEPVIGHIKQNLGMKEFNTRGVKAIKSEFGIACIANNLRRIWNQLNAQSENRLCNVFC